MIPALLAASRRRWRGRVAFEPALDLIVIPLLVPEQASECLPLYAAFVVAQGCRLDTAVKGIGFRYATSKLNGSKVVGSLLLGLYDEDGLLHHVGFTSAIKQQEKPALTAKLEPLIAKPGFTGNAPGGPSRWSTERSAQWCPLKPKLVVEVAYDHFSGERFRHGTSILRWRPDKAPRQCTFDQLKQKAADPMKLLA